MKKWNEISAGSFMKGLFAFFTAAFLLTAVLMPDRGTMFSGLVQIVTQSSKVTTNYFAVGGYAAAFLNAGLVCLAGTLLFVLTGATPNAASNLAFLLTAGFCFWGINILNIWPSILGVLLYCLVKRAKVNTQVNAMLFSTGIAPLITDLMIRYPNAEVVGFTWQGVLLALGVGLVIGFFLPGGLVNAPKVHKGYSLYSAAVPIGLTAFFLRAVLYQVLAGKLPEASTDLTVASWPVANGFCIAVFALCVVAAFAMGCSLRDYGRLLGDSGYGVDFTQKYGNAAALMNLGIFGLFILLYYNLIGAQFNAVTLGCIFCMLSCCFSGSHPGNVWPIMVGYVAASFLGKWLCIGGYTQAINAQPIVIGLCFANGLSPVSGRYGWYWGIAAGAMHFCLVTSVPLLHGGFCLYNGGFTAAFICLLLIPFLEHFFRVRESQPIQK